MIPQQMAARKKKYIGNTYLPASDRGGQVEMLTPH